MWGHAPAAVLRACVQDMNAAEKRAEMDREWTERDAARDQRHKTDAIRAVAERDELEACIQVLVELRASHLDSGPFTQAIGIAIEALKKRREEGA